jgi:hypothetical protein
LHARTKHFELQHHFIREKTESGEVNIEYVPINEQEANILIKPLGRITYALLRNNIQVHEKYLVQ